MSPVSREAIRKIAARLHRDPQTATIDEIRKLAAGWLLRIDGEVPDDEPIRTRAISKPDRRQRIQRLDDKRRIQLGVRR